MPFDGDTAVERPITFTGDSCERSGGARGRCLLEGLLERVAPLHACLTGAKSVAKQSGV